jgi:formate dehydrogenase major subunit
MPNVRVTIDGVEAAVPANVTVLEAAQLAGVEIPTLCDHPSIEPIGACRICLVEIEKQRTLQPACTFPVFEGMVAHTRSDKVVEARQFILNLLFSERNHFCMFCQMSGSCELQDLAYEYELDHWKFDRPMPKFPVDASRVYFVMDHNRCILCRRCIRVCDELVGNGTLGLKNRGAETMITADLDVPFGESSCISCGTCLQVCPTGALMDRASAYMGATAEIERVKSRCMACPVGCGVELIVRDNRVIRVEGDWEAEPNKGLICDIGRFIPLHEKRYRVRKPMVRVNGEWKTVEMDEALARVAEEMHKAGDNVATIASGFVTVEEGQKLAQAPGVKYLMQTVPTGESSAKLADLDEADLFIVVNSDLTKDYQVAGFAIKRGVRQRGARLLLIGEGDNGLAEWAMRRYSPAEASDALAIVAGAEMPVFVAGPEGAALAAELAGQVENAKLLCLTPGGNSRGLYEAGFTQAYEGQAAALYHVVAGEIANVSTALLEQLRQGGTVVVAASYREPWDDAADILLPMPTNFEKAGTTVNADGAAGQVAVGVKTRMATVGDIVDALAR